MAAGGLGGRRLPAYVRQGAAAGRFPAFEGGFRPAGQRLFQTLAEFLLPLFLLLFHRVYRAGDYILHGNSVPFRLLSGFLRHRGGFWRRGFRHWPRLRGGFYWG